MEIIIIAGVVALVVGFGSGVIGVLTVCSFLQSCGMLPRLVKDDLAADIEDPELEHDPEEERLDLIAIRDLLVASTIVGAFNGGEDTNLRHALGELRTVAAAAHDRFDELIEDLDDAAGDSVDDARPICLKCKIPFDPTDTSSEGSAMHGGGPFCRHCVTLCHDSEIADHRCMVCTPKTEAGGR